jgi:RNA polymerase primary sigma factor
MSKKKLDVLTIKQILDAYPDCLDSREKQVIDLRFRITVNSRKTLQQIGDMFGVCRERVRQIERKALRKLRHPSRLKKILEIQRGIACGSG